MPTLAESGALLEWLSYGVRYAYPQASVGYGRGIDFMEFPCFKERDGCTGSCVGVAGPRRI